jgi:hypothetical protein
MAIFIANSPVMSTLLCSLADRGSRFTELLIVMDFKVNTTIRESIC